MVGHVFFILASELVPALCCIALCKQFFTQLVSTCTNIGNPTCMCDVIMMFPFLFLLYEEETNMMMMTFSVVVSFCPNGGCKGI
jgi:hypothetical protein